MVALTTKHHQCLISPYILPEYLSPVYQGVVGDDDQMVGDGIENGKHGMVNNAHLVQHCDDEVKDEENNEQVVAERSLQDA